MKKLGNLLLVYYHPVIFDLAQSFSYFFDIEIAVISTLKDNYGSSLDVKNKGEARGLKVIFTQEALINIKQKKYQLVGCDGVFDGDKLVMDVCATEGVPWFAVMGYPNTDDEPAQNILSFSWYCAQRQFRHRLPTEGHIKELEWQAFCKDQKRGKNIFVYYPEMREAKDYAWGNRNSLLILNEPSKIRKGSISLIHRYEECNKWPHSVYRRIIDKCREKIADFDIPNHTNLNHTTVYELLSKSNTLLHSKASDCPGISLLEAMILGAVPIVSNSFLLASHNQEVLINGHSAIVCDTVDEMAAACLENHDQLECPELRVSTFEHVNMLTSFRRQRPGLEKFFERALS